MPEKKTLRVFISSPGDVIPERQMAQRVCERLNREFSYHFNIEPVLWEREPLIATEHFQTMITSPSQTDVVVVILWSSLGSPLPGDEFKGSISGDIVTGTEWEFENAVHSYQQTGVPDLLLYRKTEGIVASLDDDEALEQKRKQKRQVEKFMGRWFMDEEAGTFKAASHSFKTASQFEEMLEIHLRGLFRERLDIPGNETIRPEIHWHKGSPFRGLESFELEHASIFNGRTRAKNELREALASQAALGEVFLIVLGASGSGKSSLVKAGLLPDLILPGMVNRVGLCRYGILRPGDASDNLINGLVSTILSDTALPELVDLEYDAKSLAELLRQNNPDLFTPPFRQALSKAGKTVQLTEHAQTRLVIFIDQFEELFTNKNITKQQQEDFIASLSSLSKTGMVWIVCAMRSDFYDRLETLPILDELSKKKGSRYPLSPPVDAEIGQMITQPAQEAGLRFELDKTTSIPLDEELRNIAGDNPDVLPLLEFTLDQLWHLRTDQGVLTYEAYNQLGGMEGALGRKAEDIFNSQPTETQQSLPHVLRALVTVGQEKEASFTARTIPLSFFQKGSPEYDLTHAMLAPDARLLVADDDGDGAKLRITHEALLTHWERAGKQLQKDRHYQQIRAKLEQSAAQWKIAEDQDKASLLLRPGLPLTEAEDLLQNWLQDLKEDVIAYIESSVLSHREALAAKELATRKKNQRVRIVSSVLAVLTIFALIGAWMGYSGQKKAMKQTQLAVIEKENAENQKQLADKARDNAKKQLVEANNNFGIALLEKANAAVKTMDLNSARIYGLHSLKYLKPTAYTDKHQARNLIMNNSVYPIIFQTPKIRHHLGVVNSVAFSPDGKTMASASDDKTVILWDMKTGKQISIFKGHSFQVNSVTFSPDGKTLASASFDNITLWDLATRQVKSTLAQHLRTLSVVFSPDGKTLASASYDKTVTLWDLVTGKPEDTLKGHSGEVNSVAFSPDGITLASASDDKTVILWDMETGEQMSILKGHSGTVESVAFSPDGKTLASASSDKTVILWDITTGDQKFVFTAHSKLVNDVAFSPDGKTLASASYDKTVILWNIKTGQLKYTLKGHSSLVENVAFSPDGKTLVSASFDKTIMLWNIKTGKTKSTFEGHSNRVNCVAFSPDGKTIASASTDETVILWDIATGDQKIKLTGHSKLVNDVAFSPDGNTLASASHDKTVILWNLEIGEPQSTLKGHSDRVHSVAFSPDGKTLASSSYDQTIILWDLETGQPQKTLKGHSAPVSHVAFAPDGKTLASSSADSTIILWDIKTENQKFILKGHLSPVYHVAFSHDGKTLASASNDQAIIIWDLETGRQQAIAKGHSDTVFSSVAFSPDDKTLASASSDNTVILWDLAKMQKKAILKKHLKSVRSVAFSPDGKTLASASSDNTVILWDLVKGQIKSTLKPDSGMITAMTFSPGGKILASASNHGIVVFWDMTTGKQVSVLKRYIASVINIAFFPNGNILATALIDDKRIILWNITAGKQEMIFNRHSDYVSNVVFSPDGKTLALASANSTIILWDIKTGKQKIILKGHSNIVTGMAFSPDGKILASASADKTIILWDVKTGQLEYTLKGHSDVVFNLAFSPDSKTLASASFDHTIILWNIKTEKQESTLKGHFDIVTNLAFSPDGKFMASGSEDKTVILWDMETGQKKFTFKGSDSIRRLAFSPDGKTLVFAESDEIVVIPIINNANESAQNITEQEKNLRLHRKGLNLIQTSNQNKTNLYKNPPVLAPLWPDSHPFHWLKAAQNGNPKAMLNVGILLEGDQNYTKAFSWYEKAATLGNIMAQKRLNNLNTKLLHLKAEKLIEQAKKQVRAGDIKKAVETCSKAIEAQPNDPTGYFFRGLYSAQLKGYKQTISDYRKVTELCPAIPDGWEALGELLISLGKWQEAQEATLKAYELDPDSWKVAYTLGHTYLLFNQDKKTAREYYAMALSKIPDEESFKKGPVADFTLFIEKGWQVKACQEELSWMKSEFSKQKNVKKTSAQ